MKMLKKLLLFSMPAVFLLGCYEPLEIDTENIDKIEVPVSASMPMMNGSLTIEFDSLFDTEELGDDVISYNDGVAYFMYDTLIDFYAELSEFLTMDDVEFEELTSFEEEFSLNFEMPDVTFEYKDTIWVSTPGGPAPVPVDTFITVNPQDTFRTKYNTNAIFVAPSDVAIEPLEVLNIGDPIDFELPFEVYRVGIASGIVHLYMDHSVLANITDDYMTITPSLDYHYKQDPGIDIDTTFSQTMLVPIFKDLPQLPDGIRVVANVDIPSLVKLDESGYLSESYVVSSLDTLMTLNLADYYYNSPSGEGQIELDVEVFLEISNPSDTAMIPLPDTLYFGTYIEDMVFDHVEFNYGIDTAMSDEQVIDLDLFSSIPNDLDIEGFRLSNPEMTIAVQSNLGFPANFIINKLWFGTDGEPELITEDGTASIIIPSPIDNDPINSTLYIPANKDSIQLDSSTSRLEEVELLNVKNLTMAYDVIINPNDEAGEVGKHNFFYDYADDIVDAMYDVKLKANVRVPFEFKFDKITYQQSALGFDAETTEDIDSMFYLSDEDSIRMSVKIWTRDFPFNANAQFYFSRFDASNNLVPFDSMFASAQNLFPSSPETAWDSTSWSIVFDDQKYESLKQMDSLVMDISFTMDEDDYFQLEEGASTEIRYQFFLDNASFILDLDLSNDDE